MAARYGWNALGNVQLKSLERTLAYCSSGNGYCRLGSRDANRFGKAEIKSSWNK
jgi:hypothetical protein